MTCETARKLERDGQRIGHIRASFPVDPAPAEDGRFRAVIAVNDDVGDGSPIPLRSMDLSGYRKNPVVLFAHDRWANLPVGRTLDLRWTNRGLEATFEFLEGDDFAGRVRNAWERGYLRAASIGARPKSNNPAQYELSEWSIVPVPADQDAVRALNADIMRDMLAPVKKEASMDEAKIRELIADALKSARSDSGLDEPALARSLSDTIRQTVTAAVADAEKARADAEQAQVDAEKAFEERLEAELEERMGMDDKKKMGGMKKKMGNNPFKKKAKKAEDDDEDDEDDEEMMAKKAAEEAEIRAEARADLLVLVRGLLPNDFETRGKSDHEILVAAAGDEVATAADRSTEYLLAKVEDIAQRRADAEGKNRYTAPSSNPQRSISGGRVNMMSLRRSA